MTDDTRRIVRLATVEDGAACAAIYGPFVEDTSISFELEPPTADEMAGRIEKTTTRTPWLVVEVDGTVRGYAYGTGIATARRTTGRSSRPCTSTGTSPGAGSGAPR